MGYNAPLLAVAWNPKQHCVALAAAGGSYPVLIAYSERQGHGGAMGAGSAVGSAVGGMGMGPAGGMAMGAMGAMGAMFGASMDATLSAPMLQSPFGSGRIPTGADQALSLPGDFMSERLAAVKAKKAKRDRVAAKLADFKAKREAAKFTALANNNNVVNQQLTEPQTDGANDENKPMLSDAAIEG